MELDTNVRIEAWTFNFGASEKYGKGFLPNEVPSNAA
jgi:hypothetical protein